MYYFRTPNLKFTKNPFNGNPQIWAFCMSNVWQFEKICGWEFSEDQIQAPETWAFKSVSVCFYTFNAFLPNKSVQ